MAIPASATPDPVVPNFTAAVGPAMTGGAAGGMTNDHFGGESVATPNAQSIGDPGDRLAPLDRQRIIDMMGRLGWRFMIDDDGDVYASFSGQPTWFEQRGQQNELFVVLARWDVSLPRDQGWAALSVINQFNRETSFASAFLVDLPEQGYASVMCSLVLDCECGVTDKQLALHARDAVSGAAQLFKLMAQTFPDLH
jgi:hypothetical protein